MSSAPISGAHTDAAIFAAEDLAFGYTDELLFEQVGFHLRRGETLLLSGGSGTGKSTLLRVLARLLPLSRGALRLRGEAAHTIPAQQYRRKVAYLQQLPVMLPGSVRDNLVLSYQFSSDEPPAASALPEGLQSVGLSEIDLDQPASELSIGQQQRIAVLRLLYMQPDILLLDEPTASLDQASAKALLSCLNREQQRRGLCMVHVSHQPLDGFSSPTYKGELRGGIMEVIRA